jgi:maltooligosyltrehalose trehalohydrolase
MGDDVERDLGAGRLPVGAEAVTTGVHFRVWAPGHHAADVVLERDGQLLVHALEREADGYFSALVPGAAPGDLYRYRLAGSDELLADPASRFQPLGPHGPSEVIDPGAYTWSDGDWTGAASASPVISEVHIGTFTPDGTWRAAREKLPLLADVGIDVLEIMPVADFPGRFGWGYDGVDPFAPTRLYGRPDDMRAFVDAAHALGVAVILDVVYNHAGPDGSSLPRYTELYFSRKHRTDWGPSLNFGEDGSRHVRAFFLANVDYWIREFHLDGFRFDATQDIHDDSSEHILAAMSERARAAAGARRLLLVGENEPQDVRMIEPVEDGGYGLDALWNDDFHHSALVALTGNREAYFTDYLGGAQEFVSAVKRGFLYQGQRYQWQAKRRGTPTGGVRPQALIHFVENHDQLANSADGARIRLRTSPARYRAVMAIVMLGPATPLLFQGQEFGASAPFRYFADHRPDLADQVRLGRAEFLAQFRNLATEEMQARLPDPGAEATFASCRLDWSEFERNHEIVAFHRDLIGLRRSDPVFSSQEYAIDGAVLTNDAFVLRWFSAQGDRLLVVNLAGELRYSPAPEPLLAPPKGERWATLWSSEDARYGGAGTAPLDTDEEGWRIPGHAAVVLIPEPIVDNARHA